MRKLTVLFAALLMAGTQLFAEDIEIVVDNLKYRLDSENNTASVISHTSGIKYAEIPEQVVYENVTYTVTSIGPEAFDHCSTLTDVYIPATISSIGQAAFYYCTGLMKVVFLGNLCQNTMPSGAFQNCGKKKLGMKNPLLELPDSWGNRYLPENYSTPWYGGYFNSNRIFSIHVHKAESVAEVEAEAAKISDWSEAELAAINGFKNHISSANYRSDVDNYKTAAYEYIAQHENRKSAFAAIDAAMGAYSTSVALHTLLATEINAINAATDETTINKNRDAAIAKLPDMIAVYEVSKAEGRAEAFGSMGEPCTDCPSIEVKKGDKTVKLYNPEKVEFKKE